MAPLYRAEAVWAELPFPVAELPPPGAEARQFHAGRGEDHLRDVPQEGKLVKASLFYSLISLNELNCCFIAPRFHTN